MKVEFYGAARTVTGSCHVLRIKDKLLLLDCGLYQGHNNNDKGNEYFPFAPEKVDYVILSHAHIDHSGRIPLLYKRGFKGQIICTDATVDLCSVMLPDSGHIQEADIEWKNRKRIRQGLDRVEPLYTSDDAVQCLKLFKGYSYDRIIEIFDGLKIIFRDAGHLLGSAMIELIVEENNKEIRLVYSGDIGNKNIPIIKDPSIIKYADYVIMEATYGDRYHTDSEVDMRQLAEIIRDTFQRGGNVIIPSFAVGRAQEVIYALNKYVESNVLKGCKVYVDSPLATESTNIFKKHEEYYDEEAKKYISKGDNPLEFTGLVFTQSQEASSHLNSIQCGAVIISASGMCEAGRIKHHLKHNLWRKECAIVFVGYQAEGTLGRAIVDGAKKVRIFGEEIAVNAKIYALHGLSGHADRNGLYEWIMGFVKKPKKVFLVHGDAESLFSLKELLEDESIDSEIVAEGQIIELGEESKAKTSKKEKIISIINTLDMEKMSKEDILNILEREL